ncbi:chitin deacetylase [Mortierella alpina]|uniref:Chitin deacetylase n=1 Tax=Mortierella alpina TaxID=64518 RepID=A0A9P6J8H5_MORAP|nr:chitin deacetylase [Mortierella alpina]
MAPFTRLAFVAMLATAAFAVPVISPNPDGTPPAFSEADTYNTATSPSPALFKRAVESGVIMTCSKPGMVAITFDDGPYEYTNALLNILKAKKVKATFFLNGHNNGEIKNYKAVVKRAYDQGHQIASHTWSHTDLATLNTESEILSEMTKLDSAIKGIIGVRPTYMRPPYGSRNEFVKAVLIKAGYKIVLWDQDTNDWQHPTEVEKSLAVYKAVLGRKGEIKKNGHIFLQHDIHEKTALELAPKAIDYALKKGFKVVTVGECLGQSKSKWYRK